MTADRDLLWADMVQFDPPHADRVWEGDVGDPDAPVWYEHLGDLIHRARGPAEADELLDEPVVVDNMRRAGVGATIRALPRRRGVRTVGRMVAMKATAAATTAGLVGVAAAATTGIVATVAATVVVPAINERVLPVITHHVLPAEVAVEPSDEDRADPLGDEDADSTAPCPTDGVPCTVPGGPVVVDLPAATPNEPATVTPERTAATDAVVTVPEATVPAEAPPTDAAPVLVEPAPAPAAPAPVEAGGTVTPKVPVVAGPPPAAGGVPPVDTPAGVPEPGPAEQAADRGAGPRTEPPAPPRVHDDSSPVPPGT